MKNKRKQFPQIPTLITVILAVILLTVTFTTFRLNQKVREKQFEGGNYYSFNLGLYMPVASGFSVNEAGSKMVQKKDRSKIVIEKMKSQANTYEDFIVEFSEKNNVSTQVVSTIFEPYRGVYINGRSSTTEKGYIKMIDRNTFVVMTVNDPNEYESLDSVLNGLKYVKER